MIEDYTKRELDILFKDIKEQLDRIEIQTSKTNGSVSSLKVWRGYITGGLAVITLIGLPLLAYLGIMEMNLNEKLTSHISATPKVNAMTITK
jgi:hypothetical protein